MANSNEDKAIKDKFIGKRIQCEEVIDKSSYFGVVTDVVFDEQDRPTFSFEGGNLSELQLASIIGVRVFVIHPGWGKVADKTQIDGEPLLEYVDKCLADNQVSP